MIAYLPLSAHFLRGAAGAVAVVMLGCLGLLVAIERGCVRVTIPGVLLVFIRVQFESLEPATSAD